MGASLFTEVKLVMEDNKFVTQTAPKANIAYCAVFALLFFVMFAIAYLLLPQFGTYIFLGGALVCLTFLGVGFMLASSPPVMLRFKNDELLIADSNGKEYQVYAVPASDFVFIQTPLEKKFNIGCMRVKHTAFFMFGVKNISGTKEYIQIHFPNW